MVGHLDRRHAVVERALRHLCGENAFEHQRQLGGFLNETYIVPAQASLEWAAACVHQRQAGRKLKAHADRRIGTPRRKGINGEHDCAIACGLGPFDQIA